MILRNGGNMNVQGAITINNVVAMTKQGIALFEGSHSVVVVDLAKVTEVDSSAVSMLLEWLREAKKYGYHLQFVNIPENLESLIQLYDISELIPCINRDKQTINL